MTPSEKRVGLYAVMGSPVTHSLSPDIHTLFAEQAHIHLRYQAIDTTVDTFATTLSQFRQAGGLGANITIPCKQVAWELAGESSNRVQRAQAANTLWWEENDVLHADNTDGMGLLRDIQDNRDFPLHQQRILLLGAGGAARGILGPILDARPSTVHIFNRTPQRAEKLVAAFSDSPVHYIDADHLADTPYDVIINCTASSLTHTLPAALPEKVPAPSLCYDLAYDRDHDTAFVTWGKQQGARLSVDGLGMLVEQAAESFFIWHGHKPDTSPVLAMLTKLRNG